VMHHTARLHGPTLNLAVALALELERRSARLKLPGYGAWIEVADWRPSEQWEQGGPLIDRLDVVFEKCEQGYRARRYMRVDGQGVVHVSGGPTRLIAAMRVIVLSKLGERIEIAD
jgi:hypothetical protein